ncbi:MULTISPECIES: hypothetical protein [unclassified Sporosarcina]|uniref:hypothetical protein n=1 Tax=unclassified Sporosarcina TaxID=2647733 RepID=UPI000C1734C1|nr:MULTISPECIES: hypothetical protein [unclassified Sporosarcina]PID06121.1 hypothetical protein CSV66_06345 [Sporosarcina sp. P30]PID09315.1 hypothetical protein CSV65_06345 [Sporosarcina sp. P31]PID12614.1 hypothetical protein CSV64_05810 [Sporosarcina sp. P32b]
MDEELAMKYIVACTNLYGIVPIEKVVEIYNDQNEEKVSLDEIESYLQSTRVQEKLEESFVYIQSNEFVAEATSEKDEKENLKRIVAGKPYYVPGKEELLRYIDEEYFQETPEQLLVKNMLKEDFGNQLDVDEEVSELVYNLQVSGGDFMMELSLFVSGLELPIKESERYIPAIVEVADTTRLWENCGHTMKELQQL